MLVYKIPSKNQANAVAERQSLDTTEYANLQVNLMWRHMTSIVELQCQYFVALKIDFSYIRIAISAC